MKGGKNLSKKVKETDFLSISARVRVMETRLLTAERMERMIDAKDAAEAAKVLGECGYPDLAEPTPSALEDLLADAQGALFEDLGKAVDAPALLDVFRCKYDYHNAKTLVKAQALGIDQNRLLLRGGRYDPEALAEDFRREDLRAYTPAFQEAVARARELLGSSGDPQQADFVLDRAYYGELAALAKESGSKFLEGYVALSIDGANLRAAVRAARLDKGPDFLRLVLVEGGAVPPADIANTPGPDLARLYHNSPLAPAAEAGSALAVPNGGALTEFERLCDDAIMAYAAQARMIPFGEQPVAAYLYAREAEATAIRIILTGRMAGLDGTTIRQRLRRAYC
ncbi:MAG: V-type ATPase subunit [Oscillospiraceae bacterium]